MMTDQITVGRSYARSGVVKHRTVLAIKDGIVEYSIEGLLTFAPMKMPIDQFAKWADEAISDATQH